MAESCCVHRRKIVVGVVGILPENVCGVSDAEMADVLRFDLLSPMGSPVIAFRFCPWCGKSFGPDSEIRITERKKA